MAFLGSFLQYAIIMVILAAIALAGFFAGKKLRENKDAKAAAEADTAADYVNAESCPAPTDKREHPT